MLYCRLVIFIDPISIVWAILWDVGCVCVCIQLLRSRTLIWHFALPLCDQYHYQIPPAISIQHLGSLDIANRFPSLSIIVLRLYFIFYVNCDTTISSVTQMSLCALSCGSLQRRAWEAFLLFVCWIPNFYVCIAIIREICEKARHAAIC